jgi:hypothetical protein
MRLGDVQAAASRARILIGAFSEEGGESFDTKRRASGPSGKKTQIWHERTSVMTAHSKSRVRSRNL